VLFLNSLQIEYFIKNTLNDTGNNLNIVKKAFWFKNKQSPVIFMIDDLANIYFRDDERYNKGDWGGLLNSKNSLYCYLKDTFIKKFPELKFTFFLVSGVREVQSFGKYDFVDNSATSEFGWFLDHLISDGHEIGYHGNTHGVIDNTGRFIQEWSSFSSIEEANCSIQEGLELISTSSSVKVKGGKYCGYEEGRFGHQSIVDSKFSWWFDLWDGDVEERPYGEFKDGVFYLPSNIDCSVYSLRLFQYLNRKKYYRSVVRQMKEGLVEGRLNNLLEMKGIISLQEHTSPIRTDGKTQYPNVFDDLSSIHYLLGRLNKHDVWWATANDVAEYSRNREWIEIKMHSKTEFMFMCNDERYCTEGSLLTLIFADSICSIKVNEHYYTAYIKDDLCMVDVKVSLTDVYYMVN